jgi:ABC-2 type transport system ATP-binding protein
MTASAAAHPVLVEDFSLRLGGKSIVDGLSFDVQQGEVFAFLGSNGSGKTSTIRTLLGIYAPTSGRLLVDGRAYDPSMTSGLGYLPEERGLYGRSKVLETMTYFGELKGLTAADARSRSRAFLERVGLADKATTLLRKLSGGEQQKVQLGVTVLNDPKLLILDEPTKGLDPVNRELLLQIVLERKRAGTTIVYITHQMDEVERLADRVMILRKGSASSSARSPTCGASTGTATSRSSSRARSPTPSGLRGRELDRHERAPPAESGRDGPRRARRARFVRPAHPPLRASRGLADRHLHQDPHGEGRPWRIGTSPSRAAST